MSDITSITRTAEIVVFSGDGCPYCVEAIAALRLSGYDPKVIKASREQREELFDLTNVSSIPNIWVKGKFVGGCNDGPESWMGIKKMIDSGCLSRYIYIYINIMKSLPLHIFKSLSSLSSSPYLSLPLTLTHCLSLYHFFPPLYLPPYFSLSHIHMLFYFHQGKLKAMLE